MPCTAYLSTGFACLDSVQQLWQVDFSPLASLLFMYTFPPTESANGKAKCKPRREGMQIYTPSLLECKPAVVVDGCRRGSRRGMSKGEEDDERVGLAAGPLGGPPPRPAGRWGSHRRSRTCGRGCATPPVADPSTAVEGGAAQAASHRFGPSNSVLLAAVRFSLTRRGCGRPWLLRR
jgi:hypothetical protein